jgi:hypothetical protein
MPPSQIAAYLAYYQPGITRVYIMTTCANYLSPTRGELDAGLDVTRQVREIKGFSYQADTIERPDMANTFTPVVGGRQKADASSLVIYAAKNGVDARQTLVFGYVGYVVMLDGGDVTSYKMDIYPIQVTAKPKMRGDSNPMAIEYQTAITALPAEDVAIP